MLRLQSAADFERVRRDGRSHAHPLVVLVACRRELKNGAAGEAAPPTRCGFTASRGVGIAVARNRAKRLLREAVRARAAEIAPGWDLVFIARQRLAKSTLAQTRAAVDVLLRRADLIKR